MVNWLPGKNGQKRLRIRKSNLTSIFMEEKDQVMNNTGYNEGFSRLNSEKYHV